MFALEKSLLLILQANEWCIADCGTYEIRIIGVAAAFAVLTITLIGMSWEAKAQSGLALILLISIVDYYIGIFMVPSPLQESKGMTGLSSKTWRSFLSIIVTILFSAETLFMNFEPDFRQGETFFSVFAVFFPAVTGILAGANISGDLKVTMLGIQKSFIELTKILEWSIFHPFGYIVVDWTYYADIFELFMANWSFCASRRVGGISRSDRC